MDILIDLAGHTINNRLLVFARKPAPVQVSYLGYPNTTGLTTMDYRITDGYTDPAGVADPWSSETLVRISPTYFCYHPAADSYSTFENTLPAWRTGYLTFGSFNSHAKLSQEILMLWANILKAIPDSKLLIKTKSLQDATTRQELTEHFTSLGIVPERLILSPFTPTQIEHFRMYQQIDIALDSYPFNGATTTCETLWMGVPVVTLVGDRHASRTGLSILATVGLTELIAYTLPEYLNICLKLANNLEYVQHLRATLRHRLQTSPLMDVPSFTRY
jgi:predicted O-linked N-acetylglucosamine transferase (SPINDLY family)